MISRNVPTLLFLYLFSMLLVEVHATVVYEDMRTVRKYNSQESCSQEGQYVFQGWRESVSQSLQSLYDFAQAQYALVREYVYTGWQWISSKIWTDSQPQLRKVPEVPQE